MRISDLARKTGVMRSGAVAGTYTSGKDRPTELMMDDVYDAKKDLVTSDEKSEEKKPPKTDGNEPATPSTEAPNGTPPKKSKPRWLKITAIVVAALFALIVLASIFGTPSAEKVFNDSLDEMLQTESVTIDQEFTGSSGVSESIEMESDNFVNMEDSDNLKAKGSFSITLITEGIPIVAEADYISVDGGNYIKFTKLTSDDDLYSASFAQIEGQIKDKWIKARSGDSFASFVDIPIDSVTSVTALPYANLDDETRKDVLAVLQDEEAFEIKESAQVTVNGQSAYRYELGFNESKQEDVAKIIGDAVDYFNDDDEDEDSARIATLELWVDINTKRFIKMEYSGTSKQGSLSAVVNFSEYNESMDVAKPNEYFVESELIQ